jgi:hypothetical protein
MAAQVEHLNYQAMLRRAGFSGASSEAISEEGYTTLPELRELDDHEVDKMMDHLSRTSRDWNRNLNAQALEQQVQVDPNDLRTYPSRATLRLKIVCFILKEYHRIGKQVTSVDITLLLIDEYREHKKELHQWMAITETMATTKPDPVKNMTPKAWGEFRSQFDGLWAAKRGASLCRMTYVYRVKKTVTDEDRLAVYGCHDDMLYNCTILAGPQFKIDDSLVFEELKNALQHSTGYAFIKPFNATKNGRMAMLACINQFEGTADKSVLKTRAYAEISRAKYSRDGSAGAFTTYVAIHQDGHGVLAENGEPVPEGKKVTDFLAGITAVSMMPGKAVIMGEPSKLNDFAAAQTYLQSFVSTSDAHKSINRQVSSVANETGQKKEKGKTYTNAEWWAFSEEQRTSIRNTRSKKGTRKGAMQKKAQNKRKVSKVARRLEEVEKGKTEAKAEGKAEALAESRAEAKAEKAAKANSAGSFGRRAHNADA